MKSDKVKVAASIAIILVAALAVILVGIPSTTYANQGTGTVIDFGNMDTVWTSADTSDSNNARSIIEYACGYNGFELTFNSDGTIKSIDGISSDTVSSWGLWVIEKDSTDWKKLDAPYDSIKLSGYTVSSWSYCKSGEEPTVAVDQIGNCIYGYGRSYRTVSLSPSITEMVASVGAVETLVGTDKYSNYPRTVTAGQSSGKISIVGDFTTPSYEKIIKTNPDMILCDGSQYNHVQTAQRLRSNEMNAIVLYSGESIDTILKNIFIAGQATGYSDGASDTIVSINYASAQMTAVLDESPKSKKVNTMIALSPDKSPYVSGNDTYAADAAARMYGVNVFADYSGWTHTSSETVMEKNPSVIIILTTDYRATQSEYDEMMSSLSSEWKGTDAYKNGNIYLVCEEAGDMAQRPGPRAAQLMELLGRMMNPGVFDDLSVPKYIGDNYRDYLTFTKTIG